MIGGLLCWLGLHRFEWCDVPEPDRLTVVSYFRCRRMCRRYLFWTPGNADRIRTREGPA